MIEATIERPRFKFKYTRILQISHAHLDRGAEVNRISPPVSLTSAWPLCRR